MSIKKQLDWSGHSEVMGVTNKQYLSIICKALGIIYYWLYKTLNILQNIMDGSYLCIECMARLGVSWAVHIHGFSQRVLWGLCDIQLYEVLAKLPKWRPWPWSGIRDKATGVSFIPIVLSNSMGNGQVNNQSSPTLK